MSRTIVEVGSVIVDQTITVGNMIEIGTILIGGVIVFTQVKSRVDRLSESVKDIREDMKALNRTFTEFAVLNSRLTNVEDDIRELRHGRGFIRGAMGIEGEWPRGAG